MNKLPIISGLDLIKYFTKKKGYFVVRTSASHHILKSNEKMFPVPLYDELDRSLLADILNEAEIDREDFIREWYGK